MKFQVVLVSLLSFVTFNEGSLSDRCPVINFNQQPDCTTIKIASQCSETQPCAIGICCPGICGAGLCVNISDLYPNIEPKASCPLLPCPPPPKDTCPQGYGVDKNGCPTCICKQSAHPQCKSVPIFQPSECAAILVVNECSVEQQNCPPGKTCCPGICGARECVKIKLPESVHPQCKPVPIFHPSDCAAILVVNECSVEQQDCPPGKTCCPGICGERSCVKIKLTCPLLPCPPPPKDICPQGYDLDKNGCQTCTCKHVCRPLQCPPPPLGGCPFGFETDKYGCPTCSCKGCPRVTCFIHCPNGFAKDEKGCKTCKCKVVSPGNCPLFYPPVDCATRDVRHECSVNLQDCPPAVCPLLNCGLYPGTRCPQGYKKDKNGCPTCECKVSPSSGTCQPPPKTYCTYSKPAKIDCRTTGCPPDLKCCPINWCDEYDCIVPYPVTKPCPFLDCFRPCPNGFTKDENGCKTCKCKACPLLYCFIPCSNGYTKDENGCNTCNCKDVAPRNCPPIPIYRPIDCAARYVAHECSLNLQDCPPGKTCCPGICGATTCVRTKPVCPPLSCAQFPDFLCPLGYKKDKNGCLTCECKVVCPHINCGPYPVNLCPQGYKKDKNGCLTCECKAVCPHINCGPYPGILCPEGYKKDKNGCPTCECKVSPSSGTCQPPPNTYCTYSKPAKIDCRTTGCPPDLKCCPINWCNEYDCVVPYPITKPCPLLKCSRPCPNGFTKDENGCKTCKCKGCPRVTCLRHCPNGFAKDEKGCKTCNCKVVAPGKCPPVPFYRSIACAARYVAQECSLNLQDCPPGKTCCPGIGVCGGTTCLKLKPVCPQLNCGPYPGILCYEGYKKDKNGCPTCECKSVCPPLSCAQFPGILCPLGYKKDKNGCPTCECKVSPSSGTCQPPPKTYCTYSKPAKIDCRTTGCPPDLKCCPINWCNEYDCIVPYPITKPCPLLNCSRPCPNGFTKDENGCKTCNCKVVAPGKCPPIPIYRPIDCATRYVPHECSLNLQNCPPGKTCCPGICGATTCVRTKPVCPRLSCAPFPDILCPLGYKKDKNGCLTCECRISPSSGTCQPPPNTYCTYSKPAKIDCRTTGCPPDLKCCPINWCNEYDCIVPYPITKPCPLLNCSRPCPNGFTKDKNGCKTCNCKVVAPEKCPPIPIYRPFDCATRYVPHECSLNLQNCPPGKTCCPGICGATTCVRTKPCPCGSKCCRLYCPHGYVRDRDGCELCKCKTVCPHLNCGPYPGTLCPEGYKKDKNGCPTCECKATSRSFCPPPPNTRCGSRGPPDCHDTGCPPGRLCCAINRCNEYRCLIAITYICPITIDYHCSLYRDPTKDECKSNSQCKYGELCCMVKCRKKCIRGIKITGI